MTGFGSASTMAGGVTLNLELRAVNQRHLKLQFRLPPGSERWEETLRGVLSSRLARGHVNVTLRVGRGGEDGSQGESLTPSVRLDTARAEAYLRALRELQDRWNLPGEVDVGLVGRYERLLVEEAPEPAELVGDDTVRELAIEALNQLIEMRRREGERLAEDLGRRVEVLEAGLAEIHRVAPERLDREKERLRRSIRDLAGEVDVDADRLAREVAFIADKWDLSEEIVRARAHLAAFRELLTAPDSEPVGKRLGFLGQELLREVNTIGSKANDAGIGRLVVEMKNELESLREQGENVE